MVASSSARRGGKLKTLASIEEPACFEHDIGDRYQVAVQPARHHGGVPEIRVRTTETALIDVPGENVITLLIL